jgi:hypothetical protein
VLSLLLLALSSAVYVKTQNQLIAAKASVAQASSKLTLAMAKQKGWEAKLREGVPNFSDATKLLPLISQFKKLSYDLLTIAPEHRVLIRSSKAGSSSAVMVDLDTLATQVTDSQSLYFTTVKIEGEFIDYDEFKHFLTLLQTYPLSIIALNVRQNKFYVTLDVYGK